MASVSEPKPLSPAEERVWRTLIRLMVLMPRVIDEDLSRRAGLSLSRYVVLMRLSESPGRALRMSDLAAAAALSPSRMTRIVQPMISEGLLTREAEPADARASLARLTDVGLARLQQAWPAHLAGVRTLVIDQLNPEDLPDFQRVLGRLQAAFEDAAGR